MNRTIALRTRLSLGETRNRLRQVLEQRTSGPRPVGRVEDFTARLRWKRVLNHPFRSELVLVLEPEDDERGGLLIHGVSDITRFGRFLLIGMACILIGLTVTVGTEAGARSVLPWALLVVGALGLGVVYAVGRELARGDHDRLVGVLIRTLDARIVATPDSAD